MTVAMLTSMLVTASPAMALTAPVVTTNNTGISQNGSWDIRFTVDNAITGAAGGNITITFPSGFSVNQTTTATNVSAASGYVADATVAAGPGWLTATNFSNAVMTITTINATAATRTVFVDFAATDVIGAGAQVRIILPGGVVTNPSTPGSYAVTVVTSNDTAAVASNNIVITLPNIGPLPGQVEGKNSNGDVLYRNIVSDLTNVINTPGVSTIELGAGTYNASNTAGIAGQTIKGVGAAGTVIMTAPAGSTPLTVSAVNVTIQNVVLQGNPNSVDGLVVITANNTNIVNSTLNGGVNQIVIAYPASVSNNRTTISDSILNVTGNVTGGVVSNGRVTTNSTYNVDLGGTAIISSMGGLTVTAGAKFNGASGQGSGIILNSTTGWGSSTITSATFTNLGNNALVSAGTNSSASVQVSTSTFTGCGNSTATSSTTDGVITASGAADLILINNTISGSAAAAYGVYVSGGNVTARFNTISNTLNVKWTSGTANAVNNWWGSASGPSSSSLSGTGVTTTPFLSAITSSATTVFTSSNLSGGTPGGLPAGIDVTSTNATTGASLNWSSASVAKYSTNPQSTAPAGTPIAYYDVYVAGASVESGSTITIRFYTSGLSANSKLYFASSMTGGWVLVPNAAVSADNTFVVVTVTPSSTPAIVDLGRTPFDITNVVPAPTAPVLLGPDAGRDNIPTNTGFSWSAVTGATYDFQVSISPTFATTVASVTGLTSNVYGGVALAANTTYFWRVRSMVGTVMSAYTVSTFTTAAPVSATTAPPAPPVVIPAPVVNITAPPPATVTVQPPPPANVTVNPPAVTVQAPPAANVVVNVPEQTPAIPTMILWVIILIGAVLIIALIVLIVRTRRVA